jgi:hypothetical protein
VITLASRFARCWPNGARDSIASRLCKSWRGGAAYVELDGQPGCKLVGGPYRDIDGHVGCSLADTWMLFGSRDESCSETMIGSRFEIAAVSRTHHALMRLEIEGVDRRQVDRRLRFVIPGQAPAPAAPRPLVKR